MKRVVFFAAAILSFVFIHIYCISNVDVVVEMPPVIEESVIEELLPTEDIIVDPEVEEEVISETISVTGENRIKIATMLAKTIYGESRGIYSITEKACIVWTVLNRVDNGQGNIEEVLTAPNQFYYGEKFPTIDDHGCNLVDLALDVIHRWEREHAGETDVGRVLPKEYFWYGGKNEHNWFRDDFIVKNANIWDYSLESPYES